MSDNTPAAPQKTRTEDTNRSKLRYFFCFLAGETDVCPAALDCGICKEYYIARLTWRNKVFIRGS
ncbi:hypothetical protein BaRGS_00038427, partial [Batillaria attramentaria]